jgi:tryptophan synthase alpha subunit
MELINDTKKERKPNVWLDYVNQIREKNPEKKYKEILKLAKESYVKVDKPIVEKAPRKRVKKEKVIEPEPEVDSDQ